MAEAQDSGPLPGETFTLGRWRQIFGDEPAIVGDTDGSAFRLTLPPASNVAEIGSPTLESIAIVGGHPLIIPAGTTQSIEIPPSSNAGAGRTDIIAARWDPVNFNTEPGPVRLVRIGGTEGSSALPTYSPPLTFPLWAVTRKLNQALNQAAPRDMRMRSGKYYDVPSGGTLPANAPLGSRATRDGITYRRTLVESVVDWVVELRPTTKLTYGSLTTGAFPGWIQQTTQRLVYDERTKFVWVHIEVQKNGGQIIASSDGTIPGHTDVVTLDTPWKPPVPVSCSGYVTSDAGARRDAGGQITTGGLVRFSSTHPGAAIRTLTLDAFYAKS